MHAPLSPAYRVEWRDSAALEAIADDWRNLAGRASEPNTFYEPSFALAAMPALGADAGALAVWSRSRLMGLFPVRIERHRYGPCGALIGWTHDYGPLGVPLLDHEEPAAVVRALIDHIANDRSLPGLLMLPLITERGPFAAALDTAIEQRDLHAASFGRHHRAALAPGAGRDGYLERAISAGRRKELRRQRRRLSDIAPVTFKTVTAPAEINAALNDFLVLEASGWKGMAGTAAAMTPAIRQFIETAVNALAAEGKARVHRLYLNSGVIAASITLQSGDTAWCWKIAYSEGVAHASPGVQLMLDLTDELLADRNVRRVDSCATPDHPMIDHIWRERLTLSDRLIAVRPLAVGFAFACGVEHLRRSALGAARALRHRLRVG
jgi:CelD/BcsL family acetyltransferase involved in cellulose biosynthesis